ncbi:uncharacterized protein LOC141853908 [Brevipalpus obovatus]|uniref:uncharacterized protein LOC141853908 n=1 Tax=Brevipalpus obovatus TaxID=246614 RepID=UPI003D9E0039
MIIAPAKSSTGTPSLTVNPNSSGGVNHNFTPTQNRDDISHVHNSTVNQMAFVASTTNGRLVKHHFPAHPINLSDRTLFMSSNISAVPFQPGSMHPQALQPLPPPPPPTSSTTHCVENQWYSLVHPANSSNGSSGQCQPPSMAAIKHVNTNVNQNNNICLSNKVPIQLGRPRNIPRATVRNGLWPRSDPRIHQQYHSFNMVQSFPFSGTGSESWKPNPSTTRAPIPMNSSLVRRRIMILYDNLQYEELAQFIERIPNSIFDEVLTKLPVNDFLNSMPSTIKIMESLYLKFEQSRLLVTEQQSSAELNTSNSSSSNQQAPKVSSQSINNQQPSSGRSNGLSSPTSQAKIDHLQPQKMMLHLMEIFAHQSVKIPTPNNCSNEINSCNNIATQQQQAQQQLLFKHDNFTFNHSLISPSKNILKVIMMYQPSARKQLIARKKGLDKAIEGMGHHGLVGTSDETLLELNDALKIEFTRGISNLKSALNRIEDSVLSSSKKVPTVKSVTRGPAPTQASHQRQLSLRQEELQDRLSRNQALLAAIEPCCRSSQCLQNLCDIVEQRINHDKEVLLQYNELRRLFNTNGSTHLINTNGLTNSNGNGNGHNVTGLSVWNTFDTATTMIAPIMMRFSHGLGQVLTLVQEVCQENNIKVDNISGGESHGEENVEELDRSSDISGYHSGSDTNRNNIQNGTSDKSSSDIKSEKDTVVTSKSNTQHCTVTNEIDHQKRSQQQQQQQQQRQEHRIHKDMDQTNSFLMDHCDDEKEPLLPDEPQIKIERLRNLSETSKTNNLNNNCNGNKNGGSNDSVMVKGSIWTHKVYDDSEVEVLKKELAKAKQTISKLQEREQKMRDRLAEQAHKLINRGIKLENSGTNDKRPTALIRKYGNLYAQARVDTLDSLNSLSQLKDADELKSKLLFSLVVLSFCSVQKTLNGLKQQVKDVLQIPENTSDKVLKSAIDDLNNSLNAYLRVKLDIFDPRSDSEEVLNQICATLYDYPCLRECDGLLHYIRDCVSLAWTLSIQDPDYSIEYESKKFNKDMHVRFHTSDQSSDTIKSYLWPCLIESNNGPCVHKGVVIT